MDTKKRYLVLGAMGVLYRCCDDVKDILIPYLREKGAPDTRLEEAVRSCRAASIGRLTSTQVWQRIGMTPKAESEFLARFRLTEGLIPFLARARDHYAAVYCLSNDVSEWSEKLRRRFGLDKYVSRWCISADMGCRKPDELIFKLFLHAVKADDPAAYTFVDDRVANLDVARRLGMATVLFTANHGDARSYSGGHRVAPDFGALLPTTV
jgi:FMN phosphatase YigB (HAD superfamily)